MNHRNLISQLRLFCKFLFVATSSLACCQDFDADVAKMTREIPAQCEKPAAILAEAKLRKWTAKAKELGRTVSDEDRQAVFSVMKDQCVSVQLILVLRALKATISASDWAKLKGDEQIESLMLRVGRTM